jgi:ferredoxin
MARRQSRASFGRIGIERMESKDCVSVVICFLPDGVEVAAEVGESLLSVAARAGIDIPTGCLMGSCHACEVTVEEFGDICSCITGVPPGFPRLTIQLFSDPTW